MNILILSARPDVASFIASQFQHSASWIHVAPSLAKSKPILRKSEIDYVAVTDFVSDAMLEDIRGILLGMIDYTPPLVHVRSSRGSTPCYCGLDSCIPLSNKLSESNIFRDIQSHGGAPVEAVVHSDWRARRTSLEVNGYRLIPECNHVNYKNESIRLRQKEFDLAYLIFKYYKEVVTHDEIMKLLWPGDDTKTLRNIVPHMSIIRRKLNLTPENGLVIKSIYGEGYRLEEWDPLHHG
ncbi:winged helix-turn-helix domain-containing protein [Burkholderia contaminans]|uniref:winged helix-turn-helix domain-containing protein n=1 Tax=Burkholderia contaminans TaxID=488447 RepID=UPI002415E2E0|nr:winged helix-turn-helix domain-containing protein [Burkholderia contaminans]WFN15041.1 winged helix-turn-helix domain-containing protein [Burkholderia contaminans]